MSKFIDMTGWIMSEHGVPDSKLTVVGRAEDYIRKDNGGKLVRWWSRCNCGNQELVLAFGQDLRRGHTLSCGCTREERIYASIKNTTDMIYQVNMELDGLQTPTESFILI